MYLTRLKSTQNLIGICIVLEGLALTYQMLGQTDTAVNLELMQELKFAEGRLDRRQTSGLA
jgi:hypothetical protein